jgi:hypothetical protein
MKLKARHGFIALLVLVLLYYVYSHQDNLRRGSYNNRGPRPISDQERYDINY